MQQTRSLLAYRRVAKPALAGLLALIVLVATTFSVSHALHQTLHPNAPAGNHFCLVCSLVKGQVNAADVSAALLLFTAVLVFSFPALELVIQSAVDRRLNPSRAPPRS